ncbi:MAG: hypothetical protein PHQ12_03335 [Chthoniobacteraceae bacterium]|nr:hypothetical protein [Chthoniobacteraceae bacterium]
MHRLTTAFLYAFIADGLLSMADLLGRRGAPGQMPNFFAAVVSFAVLILGLVLFFGMILTPRLSKRLLLPPLGFLGFCLLWGLLYGQRGMLPISAAEALLGLGLVAGFWNAQGGGIQDFTSSRPRFTLRNFFGTGLLNGFLGVALVGLLILGTAQKLRGKLEDSTGRYVTIQPGGILLEERRFQHDGKEIRLISMIHVAKNGFYDEIARALPAGSKAVVLLEGISDRNGYLRGKLDYSNAAHLLGFTSQQQSTFTEKAVKGLAASREAEEKNVPAPAVPPLEYRSADVDTAEFHSTTVQWIQAFGNVIQSANFQEALAKYSQSRQTFAQGTESVCTDLLDKRNEHLLGEIRKALDAHTMVVVPWGARHMPALQKEIESWGFVETERVRREAVRFENKTLVGFLACMERMPGSAAP